MATRTAQGDEHVGLLATQIEVQGTQLPGFEELLRAAQGRSSEQRAQVVQVQQQIQVLAAESRNVEEQARALTLRRERLAVEDKSLAAPDATRLDELRRQGGDLAQAHGAADSKLAALAAEVPQLDDERRAMQEAANQEAGKQASLSARVDALRALQDKVQTEGKLKPWLTRHGLDSLQGLWTRVHIEAGWEPALEAALRERLNALAVSRIETVSAFAEDAPPARLAFYTTPTAAAADTHRTLPRLADRLRLVDAGLKALLEDWLEGVYTAPSLAEALAARSKLEHGEVVMTSAGHAVSAFAVSFYAPDSEQAGMLARAQEIENLALQLRAQALMADEARSALVRSEAAATDAAFRLEQARREAADAQTRSHRSQVELLRLTEQAQATQARRERLASELAEIDEQLAALAARRATAQARFEELDLQLGTLQERDATLGEAVIEAERVLATEREQLRALERQAQEAQFVSRSLAARRAELERAIETARQQLADNEQSAAQLRAELAALADTSEQPALESAVALRLERFV